MPHKWSLQYIREDCTISVYKACFTKKTFYITRFYLGGVSIYNIILIKGKTSQSYWTDNLLNNAHWLKNTGKHKETVYRNNVNYFTLNLEKQGLRTQCWVNFSLSPKVIECRLCFCLRSSLSSHSGFGLFSEHVSLRSDLPLRTATPTPLHRDCLDKL